LLCVVEVKAQGLNGEMSASAPNESSKINLETDKSLLIIHSQVQNLQFESNRKIVNVKRVSSGEWEVWLPAGTHIIEILCKDYQSIKLEKFNYEKKKTYELSVKEVRAPRLGVTVGGKGSLFVSSEPEGAELTIDGMPGKWTTPVTIKNILATTWQLTLSLPRYDTLFIKATVFQDSLLRIENQKLIPRFGFLRFEDFQQSVVYVDNIQVAPNTNARYSLGSHTVRIQSDQYGELKKVYNLSSGEVKVVRLTDFLEPGFLDLSTDVVADIYVDGKIAGKNNVRYETLPGEHTIKYVHSNLGEESILIDVQPTKEKKVFLPMLPSRSTALWRCLIPGTSQIYTKQTTRGYLYLTSFIVSAAASVYFYNDYTTRKSEYDAAISNYRSAVTPDNIALYRNQVISQYDKLDQARKFRDIGLISSAAIFTISLLDRLIFPPQYGYRQREPSISMEIQRNPNLDGIQLTWKIPQ